MLSKHGIQHIECHMDFIGDFAIHRIKRPMHQLKWQTYYTLHIAYPISVVNMHVPKDSRKSMTKIFLKFGIHVEVVIRYLHWPYIEVSIQLRLHEATK